MSPSACIAWEVSVYVVPSTSRISQRRRTQHAHVPTVPTRNKRKPALAKLPPERVNDLMKPGRGLGPLLLLERRSKDGDVSRPKGPSQ